MPSILTLINTFHLKQLIFLNISVCGKCLHPKANSLIFFLHICLKMQILHFLYIYTKWRPHKMEATSKLLINTHFWNIKKNFLFFYWFFFFHMSGDQKSSNGCCGIICTWWWGERMWFRGGVTCRSADIRFQCSAKHILQIIYRAPRDVLYPNSHP